MSRVVDLWLRKDRTRTARYGRGRRWMAVWTDGTGRMVRTTHATKDAAAAWIRDQDAAHATGSLADRDRSRATVAELGVQWLAGRVQVAPRTKADDERIWAGHVVPAWGDRAVGTLRRDEIQVWVAQLTARYAARTVDTIVRRLQTFLTWCAENRYIPSSPATRLDLPRGNKREHYYLTVAEFQAIRDGLPAWAHDAVLTAVTTGVRPGELWELRAGDVDLERRRVRVARSVSHQGRGVRVGPPKNGKSRDVPLTPLVVELLRPRVEGRLRDALLFTSEQGRQVRGNNFARRVWKTATTAAGLEGVRFYDLRHTAASWAIRSGASVLVVQRMLGHASASMTLDVYAGLWDQDLDDVAGRIGAMLEDGLNVPNDTRTTLDPS